MRLRHCRPKGPVSIAGYTGYLASFMFGQILGIRDTGVPTVAVLGAFGCPSLGVVVTEPLTEGKELPNRSIASASAAIWTPGHRPSASLQVSILLEDVVQRPRASRFAAC